MKPCLLASPLNFETCRNSELGTRNGRERHLSFEEKSGIDNPRAHFVGSEDGSSEQMQSSTKWINDPVHGHIELDEVCMDFVDTEQFQRLRDLKQLGSAYYVFPGASHNRFEHSIGVCHLSGELISRFKSEQPELHISESDVKCLKLAGLCHDLGHGPFSHIFDTEFMPRARPGAKWSHEDASEMMLDYLIEDNNIDLDKADTQFIKDLIHGLPRSQSERSERGYLYEIVANKKNSIDVDKFDYITRDCYNLNHKSAYDSTRLLKFSRVVNNEITYHQKEAYNIYEMFHTRYSLFKKIYTHKVGKAVEYMITDALLLADPYLKISGMVDNAKDYLHLADDILRTIERSKVPELSESRAIIKRLRVRQLYKFVDEMLLPDNLKDRITKKEINPERICEYGADITPNDIIVEWLKYNYAHQDKNPVDHVRFYNKFDLNSSFPMVRNHISFLVPDHFEEINIRVFARNAQKIQAIQTAFRRLLRELNITIETPEALDFSDHLLTPNMATLRYSSATPGSPGNVMTAQNASLNVSPARIDLQPHPAHTLPQEFRSPKKRRYESPGNEIVTNWS